MFGLRSLDAFIAVDVETANSDQSSICSIGLAVFRSGQLVQTWNSLVNPECHFDKVNISIHGIREIDVKNAPPIGTLARVMWRALDNSVVVSHTAFDKTAINRAAKNARVNKPRCIWLDSSLVARRTWAGFAKRGYGLKPVCDYLGYEFDHHNALEDAKAAGHIVVSAMKTTSSNVSDILSNCYRGQWKDDAARLSVSCAPTASGPLSGEVMAFTGNISLGRYEAAQSAASLGCRIVDSVNGKTTILVVGSSSGSASGKLEKARGFIADGHSITLISEHQLYELFGQYDRVAPFGAQTRRASMLQMS